MRRGLSCVLVVGVVGEHTEGNQRGRTWTARGWPHTVAVTFTGSTTLRQRCPARPVRCILPLPPNPEPQLRRACLHIFQAARKVSRLHPPERCPGPAPSVLVDSPKLCDRQPRCGERRNRPGMPAAAPWPGLVRSGLERSSLSNGSRSSYTSPKSPQISAGTRFQGHHETPTTSATRQRSRRTAARQLSPFTAFSGAPR